MNIPKMNRQAVITAKVPTLAGGVNLSDAPNLIGDNQLTQVNNMWWHEAALRTRPGLAQTQIGDLPVGATGAVAQFATSVPVSERERLLGAVRNPPTGESGCTFFGYSMDVEQGLTHLGYRTDVGMQEDGSAPTGFCTKATKGSQTSYYFYLSDGSVLTQGEDMGDPALRRLVDAEPYVPLVLVNGLGVATKEEEAAMEKPEGTFFEGYNMLADKFRCSYTTNGEGRLFKLPMKGLSRELADFSAELTLYDWGAQALYTATATATSMDDVLGEQIIYFRNVPARAVMAEEDWDNDNRDHATVTLKLNGEEGYFYTTCNFFDATEENWLGTTNALPRCSNNNLVVTVGKEATEERATICGMTRCTWFGGDRSGVNGGTRLFVCGNPNKPNLVHWSDVNKPLYFPENNYAYIGGGDEAVTGFGKQADLLIIFKEHELYSAQYVAGTDYTYEDVVSGKVTDVTAAAATFPIAPLHSAIGCDCPDSIRLVNNKLVWCVSDGHVYMTTSVNQWSERNVRDITARIRPHLEGQDSAALRRAVGGEYKGYYTLFIPDSGVMYLLDAGNSAFQSYAYYASEKKASGALPWYIWELPAGGYVGYTWVTAVSDGERLRLLRQSAAAQLWSLCEAEGDSDEGAAIPASFTTKLFDFDRMDVKKAIVGLYLALTAAEGCEARVSYITEEYVAQDAYVLYGDGGLERTAEGRRVRRLTPGVHRVNLFGVKVECEGAMAATGMTIQYKTQGVVR